MKYKIKYQREKPYRIKKTDFFLTKDNGNNDWYYPEYNKWGDLGEYNWPVINGTDKFTSIKAIIRHIKKQKPEKGDVYKVTRYIGHDIYIIIK